MVLMHLPPSITLYIHQLLLTQSREESKLNLSSCVPTLNHIERSAPPVENRDATEPWGQLDYFHLSRFSL